ncbi:unnamed protein product [Scytosiphon promiscuus]
MELQSDVMPPAPKAAVPVVGSPCTNPAAVAQGSGPQRPASTGGYSSGRPPTSRTAVAAAITATSTSWSEIQADRSDRSSGSSSISRAGHDSCDQGQLAVRSTQAAPLSDVRIRNLSRTSTPSLLGKTPCSGDLEERYGLRKKPRPRRASSCPSRTCKTAKLATDESKPSPSMACGGRVALLLENTVYNLNGVIATFQQGVRAREFKDGDLAARNGHMYIVTQVAATFSSQAMVLAAAQGHLEMVAYLHHNREEGTTVEALDLAATFGHLEVVKFLHENRQEGCTTRAMDGAAGNNHLDVLVFLHENRSEGATATAVDSAALNGHLRILKWLTENMPGLAATTAAMDGAAFSGHLEAVRFLHEARREGCTTDAMDSASRRGNFEVVKFLHENRQEGCTTAAVDNAASAGHLELLKFLSSNRTEGGTVYAMILAAWHGHLDVVKWLHSNREEGCTTSAMNGAAYNAHLDVVRWLHENRSEVRRRGPQCEQQWCFSHAPFLALQDYHAVAVFLKCAFSPRCDRLNDVFFSLKIMFFFSDTPSTTRDCLEKPQTSEKNACNDDEHFVFCRSSSCFREFPSDSAAEWWWSRIFAVRHLQARLLPSFVFENEFPFAPCPYPAKTCDVVGANLRPSKIGAEEKVSGSRNYLAVFC